MKFEDKIKEFEQLNFEQKRKKCFDMLEILKWSWEIFWDLYDMLKSIWEHVSEELLVSIYTWIQSAIFHIDSKELKNALDNIKKLREKLLDIQKREIEARKNENPEKLLENL